MTSADVPVTPQELLAGEYNLSGADLGLSDEAYAQRLELWTRLAGRTPGLTAAQQEAALRVLALRAWVTVLIGKADKFRAEGDITVERDIMKRIGVVQDWLNAAEAQATPPASAPRRSPANPAPEIVGWDLR